MARLFTFILICISSVAFSQGNARLMDKVSAGMNISDLLMSLREMEELAVQNSPLLKLQDADILISELKVKSEKREWLSYFRADGSVKYGLFDNLIVTEDVNTASATSTTEQTRYSAGVSVQIPFNLVGNKIKVKQARAELNKAHFQRESTLRELKKLVIIQYSNVLKAQKRMLIFISKYESLKIQMMDIELNYKNGKINIKDYTNTKNVLLDSELALEEMKIELTVALNILEETVGVKFNLN